MPLKQDQITQLYKFTRTHFVEHYDLQTELVDHLANGIEQTQKVNPSLSFQEALQLEFKKFGVCGFNDVVEERRKAISKRYFKLFWQFFKDWFKIPKVIFSFSALGVIFLILQNLKQYGISSWFIGLFFGCLLVIFLFKGIEFRRKMKKRDRKWMMEEMIFNQLAIANFYFLPIHLLNFGDSWTWLLENTLGQVITSCLILVAGLIFVTTLFIIPERAEELLTETYPEYSIR